MLLSLSFQYFTELSSKIALPYAGEDYERPYGRYDNCKNK